MATRVFIYSDGGARGNPGPAGIGILICDAKGLILKDHAEVIGETTNNVAEYTAVIVGLELAHQLGATEVDYTVDSQLVANQLSGKYKIKTPHIRVLADQAFDRIKKFERVTFRQVGREHEKIRYVDRLVNRALDAAGH